MKAILFHCFVETSTKDGNTVKEEADWDNEDTVNLSQTSSETKNKWTDSANIANENWGKELSSGTGSLSDWGTANVTEDWDAPGESSFGTNWTEPQAGDPTDSVKIEHPVIGTIGSEMKSGKIPKKEANMFTGKTEKTSSGQYGAVGQPILKDSVSELSKLKDADIEKDRTVPKDLSYKDVIGTNTGNEVKEELLKTGKLIGPKNVDVSKLQGSKVASPKLTGWSGLDGFEPLPSYSSSPEPLPQPGLSVTDSNTKIKPKAEINIGTTGRTVDHDITGKEQHIDTTLDLPKREQSPTRGLETDRATDEWGWTTASSKKTKVLTG